MNPSTSSEDDELPDIPRYGPKDFDDDAGPSRQGNIYVMFCL